MSFFKNKIKSQKTDKSEKKSLFTKLFFFAII